MAHDEEAHVRRSGIEEVHDVVVNEPATRNAGVYRLQETIYLLFGIIEVLIAIRFVLRAFGANPAAPFAASIYTVTGPLIAPFNGMFGTPRLSLSVFEPQSIVAIVVYALLGWALGKIIWIILADTRSVAATETRTTTSEHRSDQDFAA